MKMKEVCDKTGLTERAVRFYVAKGLVSPELIVRNDREYREYSREDVQTLRDISDLRKLSFSIEEILSMQKSPERIAEVLSVRRAALRKEQKDREIILASLSRMDGSGMQSIHQLAEQFRSVSASLPNPDIALHFDRLEDLEAEEKEKAYQAFLERQRRLSETGEKMVIGIIAAQVISIVLTLFTGSFSLLGAGLTIACCVALYRGVSWVRYAMAVLNLITLFLYFMIFVEAITLGQPLPAWFWLLFAVLFAVVAVQCALLFFSRAVSEFMYGQSTGR